MSRNETFFQFNKQVKTSQSPGWPIFLYFFSSHPLSPNLSLVVLLLFLSWAQPRSWPVGPVASLPTGSQLLLKMCSRKKTRRASSHSSISPSSHLRGHSHIRVTMATLMRWLMTIHQRCRLIGRACEGGTLHIHQGDLGPHRSTSIRPLRIIKEFFGSCSRHLYFAPPPPPTSQFTYGFNLAPSISPLLFSLITGEPSIPHLPTPHYGQPALHRPPSSHFSQRILCSPSL